MKLIIDTVEKTIEIEENINLDELMKEVKELLPDWKDYDINVRTMQTVYPYYPYYPVYPTWIVNWNDTTSIDRNY